VWLRQNVFGGLDRPAEGLHAHRSAFTYGRRAVRRCGFGLENVDDLKPISTAAFAALKAAGQDAIPSNDFRQSSAAAQRRIMGAWRSSLLRTNPDFAGAGTNYPFTMTMNPAVLSTKSFTPQVPLYH
jgi:hypothetical protein